MQSEVEHYVDNPTPLNLRKLYLTYFQWRMGGRRLYGLARRSDGAARLRAQDDPGVLTPDAVRDAERRVSSELRNALRLPLAAAAGLPETSGFRVAGAARELGRDLHMDGLPHGPKLRIGTMRRGPDPKRWVIEPYAPGLPNVPVSPKGLSQLLLGSAVLYMTDARGASAIEAVSPEAAKRRRSRPKC